MRYAPDDLIARAPDWHYREFEQRAYQISAQLQQQGVHSIAVWFEDGAALACTLLACWHAKVKVLFPPNDTPESLDWVAEYANLWLTDREFSPNTAVKICHFLDFGKEISEQAVQKMRENQPLVNRQNSTELWLKTSGSTGEAKTIVKTAAEMWLSAEILAESLPFPANNRTTVISSVSIQHIYGLTVHIMMALVQGWVIGRKQQFFPECLVVESQQREAALLVSSPAMLSRMQWQQLVLPNVIGVISSGGALAEADSEQIRQSLKQPVVEIYGSTETGPIAIRQDIGLWQTLPESEVGCDENGALWLAAKWVAEPFQTADAVEIYPNGFKLLGRIDRIVKIGDKRTSLVGVEHALNQHSWVEDSYITQHPDQPRLAAWVGLTAEGIDALREQGRKAVVEQLKHHLTTSQEKTAIPRFWRFCDKLPRNSQSKISKLEFEQICRQPILDPIWLGEEKHDNLQIFYGKIPLDLHYFKGHFANFPLVPGVIELQWVMEKIYAFFGQEKVVQRIDNLKFQKFVRPNDEFELQLKWDIAKNRMGFQFKTAGEMCGSGLVVFADE